jgi:hypothetical protein
LDHGRKVHSEGKGTLLHLSGIWEKGSSGK